MGDLWQKWWTLFSFSSCPLILHFSLLTPSSPLLVSRSFSFFTLWTLFYTFSSFFCVTIWRWSKSQLHTLVYICSNGTPLYRRHRWNYGMNTSVLRHSSPELLPFVWDFCFPSSWHGVVFGGRFFFFFCYYLFGDGEQGRVVVTFFLLWYFIHSSLLPSDLVSH